MAFADMESAVVLSSSYDEIVTVESDDVDAAVSELRELAQRDGYEFDSVRGNDAVECWAYDADAPEGEMKWRVHLVYSGKSAYTTELWGEKYSLLANWAEASSQIERNTEDGGWEPTGYQVADFSHSPEDAMREELRQAYILGGDEPDEAMIDAAIAGMEG